MPQVCHDGTAIIPHGERARMVRTHFCSNETTVQQDWERAQDDTAILSQGRIHSANDGEIDRLSRIVLARRHCCNSGMERDSCTLSPLGKYGFPRSVFDVHWRVDSQSIYSDRRFGKHV